MTVMAARTTKKTAVPQVPASRPARVEIRVDGRLHFANNCYDLQISQGDGVLSVTAALNPTMVDAPAPMPQQNFGDDIRDGDKVIQQVHSGRRV
jgi:hypothetical protein